uniref:Plexin cytoplasmic RasGAP domain-containing protein n=1 Tax=Poecilia reticulata TaxID=8081 RepID=A0A3P9PBQ0_POERE
MKTLLQDLVQQYVAKNPKLMLRRTETVVEKMLTNWMSICLYSFLKEVAGEPLYMLYRAIKYQVDKGPVDAVTGKAKRTLNDSHLLREDIDYSAMVTIVQPCPIKVLDTDTITQVKDKILDQVYRGAPFSQRPAADSLDLGVRTDQSQRVSAFLSHCCSSLRHILRSSGSRWRHSRPHPSISQFRGQPGGTLQKFVDDVFVAILSTKRPPPIAVRFFFDFLDDMAEKHGIDDPETVHIWKTNSLPLRFWVNILKNPQFVLDVQVTDSIDGWGPQAQASKYVLHQWCRTHQFHMWTH